MLYIEHENSKLADWVSRQTITGRELVEVIRGSKMRTAHDLLGFKAVVRQLAEGGPFLQPETIINFDLSAEETSYFYQFTQELYGAHSHPNKDISVKLEESRVRYPLIAELPVISFQSTFDRLVNGSGNDYYLKQNDSALGMNVIHIKRDENKNFSLTVLNNYGRNENKLPVFIYLDLLSSFGIVQKTMHPNTATFDISHDDLNVLKNVLGLQMFEGYFYQNNNLGITKNASILESTFTDLIRVNGRAYETRHLLKANIPKKIIHREISHAAKFGGSADFGTISSLNSPNLAKFKTDNDIFEPVFDFLPQSKHKQFIPKLESTFRQYVRHIQERLHLMYPTVVESITYDSNFTIDLAWKMHDGEIIPCLIENHIE